MTLVRGNATTMAVKNVRESWKSLCACVISSLADTMRVLIDASSWCEVRCSSSRCRDVAPGMSPCWNRSNTR